MWESIAALQGVPQVADSYYVPNSSLQKRLQLRRRRQISFQIFVLPEPEWIHGHLLSGT